MNEQLHNIPDILYKYRVWEDPYHKRILTHNELFFSSADLFNDPFDSSLPFQYVPEDMTPENVYTKLILMGKRLWPGIPEEELEKRAKKKYNDVDFNSDDYWEQFYPEFKKKVNERYGIYSLTSKKDNLLMWSHYANSHKGFCIGLEKMEIFQASNGMIGPVIYSNDFPKIPLFDETLESFMGLLLTKSKHWEYEDEYRILKSFAPRKIIEIKESTIKEIIFGARIDKNSRDEIIQLAKARNLQIKLFDSVIDTKTFKTNIIELK